MQPERDDVSNNEGVFTTTITTAYAAEGRVIAQRGATYPVDYAYDEFGDKISMTTYRDINAAGDVTRWHRDEATRDKGQNLLIH